MNVLSCVYVVWSAYLAAVQGYNIEVSEGKVGISRGEAGTQFGYTVGIVKAPGWDTSNVEHPKLLLAGAPNRTVVKNGDTIKGHGDLSNCNNPAGKIIKCTWMNITEKYNGKTLCELVKKPYNIHCEEDSRMGASLAINRKFESIQSSNVYTPMVSVCAPGWKNVYPTNQNYELGMCLKMRKELEVLDCKVNGFGSAQQYCWPFWPSQNAFVGGRPMKAYSQAGLSAAFSWDGESELIGAPGVSDWRGGYRLIEKSIERILHDSQKSTTYYGYSITSGRFKVRGGNIAAGNPNYHTANKGHNGRVEILKDTMKVDVLEFGMPKICATVKYIPKTDLDYKQVGTKFGAVVAAIDITGDGYDELFVGAPLFTGEAAEEGRVYVYTSTSEKICGPIGVLSGSAKNLLPRSHFARFGTSIISAGDLDKDGYNDIAVGAPYEDDGVGAVYIYQGIGACDCLMKDEPIQIIKGKQIHADIRGFGWSLYGDDDIDYNEYPDLAVGAYTSDIAVVLRTRPIVKIHVDMVIEPSTIPLNGSLLSCSKDGNQLCMEVDVTITAYGNDDKSATDDINLSWDMDLDTAYTQHGDLSRLVFRDTGLFKRRENITLTADDLKDRFIKKNYTIDVLMYKGKPEPQDAWTKIRIEGEFDLIATKQDIFEELDPVLDKNEPRHFIAEADFDKKCPSLDECVSDLDLSVDLFLGNSVQVNAQPDPISNDTIIYVDTSRDLLQMEVDVKNILDSSYRANFSSYVEAVTRKTIDTNLGKIESSCKTIDAGDGRDKGVTNMTCSADSKLDEDDNFKVRTYYDISQARLVPEKNMDKMQRWINISVRAGQANSDTDPANNVYTKTFEVQLKYVVDFIEDKEESDQVRYKADTQSTRIIKLLHRYYLINKGPSFLPKTKVLISVPYKKSNVNLAKIKSALVGDSGQACLVHSEGQIQTTKTPTLTTTTKRTTTFKIEEPDQQRKRREAPINEKPVALPQTDVSKTTNITCETSDCFLVECEVKGLEKSRTETIDVVIEIFESAIAKEKEVRKILYASNATVIDPYKWYGGKVVQWTKTYYAKKWTTLVVENASVVSEINIWIIIGSVLGAVALLVIVIVVLWKIGFFKRKKHTEVKKWKRDSLYKRKSQMPAAMAPKTDQPYTPMESKTDATS